MGILFLVLPFLISGCLGPVSLHRAVMSYDETISRLEREMLLLNVARTHCQVPSHYTVASSIAATFDYRSNAGFSIDDNVFNLGVSASENPTLSIVPIQGEEFTKRVITPLGESTFLFLIFQGAPVDMVMRLMARGIEIQNEDGTFQRFILNRSLRPEEYEEFRRMALHLAWLNENRKLFVGRISFEDSVSVKLPGPLSAGDLTDALKNGYLWRKGYEDGSYELTKPVTGRVAVTNYDLRTLTHAERRTLNNLASANPGNFILVDIRRAYPGGDFPVFGAIKLRSLSEITEFLAEGIDRGAEFDVNPDPRSGEVPPNPRSTLTILIDRSTNPDAVQVSYGGHTYAVGDTPWDRQAFKYFYQLFQMTVTDVSRVGIPITISK
jgi:hypothetical protein